MPDIHAGAGCTIGATMTITNRGVPNLAGVEISALVAQMKAKGQDRKFKKNERS